MGSCALYFSIMKSIHLGSFEWEAFILLKLHSGQKKNSLKNNITKGNNSKIIKKELWFLFTAQSPLRDLSNSEVSNQ